VLNATPGARLRLKYQKHYDAPACRARILDRLVAGGVDPARVEFLPGSLNSVSEHLALYDGVDVALDPFPFSGSTTTFEALFMGVPVVTLPQPRLVARWSASILTTVGLTAFIADSFNDYIAIALRAATDPQGLAALRAELRERVLTSSLCDAPRMARHLERVYRALWRRWCASVSQEKRNPEDEA
jgi:protein O-GlcNAc transferase